MPQNSWTDRVPPPGKVGDFEIVNYEISPEEASLFNLRCMFNFRNFMSVLPGKFTKLIDRRHGDFWMSNTQMERTTARLFCRNAHGRVLIFGLGLGMVLNRIHDQPKVKSIVVVEKFDEVIQLVAPTFEDMEKLTIVQGDAWTWRPDKGQKFDTIWFDIWATFDFDNRPEFKRLKLRSVPWRSTKRAWVGCWSQKELVELKKSFIKKAAFDTSLNDMLRRHEKNGDRLGKDVDDGKKV